MLFLQPHMRMALAVGAIACLMGGALPLAAQTTAPVPNAPADTMQDTGAATPVAPALDAPAAQTPATETAAPDATSPEQSAIAPAAPESVTPSASTTPEAPGTLAATSAAPEESDAPAAAETAGVEHGLQGHDLSPMGMYRQADIVVKAVMISLVVAAIAAWIILIVKLLQLAGAKARARKVLRIVAAARDLPAAQQGLQSQRGLAATLVHAAGDEVAVSQDIIAQGLYDGVKERVASRLSRIEAAGARKIGQGVGILASIGSVGPFVGLFGTVWGIMNSFIGIAESQTTNLAVVAPGIAEALLATAFGLVAAIPAVIIYNGLARATTGYRALLGDLSAAIERLVSRDLDRAALTAER